MNFPICSDPESDVLLSLRIAGICVSMKSFQPWNMEEAFRPFVETVPVPDYRVIFRWTDTLPRIPAQVLYEGECYRIHPGGLRSFFDAPRQTEPYAVAEYDWENAEVRIACLPEGAHCVAQMHNSFFHIDIESMMIGKQRIFLHASCVDTPLGGILFSGPSGIGKSTQAELWCACRGAKQINGDRPILSKDAQGWLAWGAPYAGSSGCHVNENCRVRAIVMLEQGPSCRLCRLKPSEAFREVWAGLTVHSWDRNFVERAVDLALDLIGTVPVYRFTCTPDVSAVEYLQEHLGKDFAYGTESNRCPPADGISVCQGEPDENSAERNL